MQVYAMHSLDRDEPLDGSFRFRWTPAAKRGRFRQPTSSEPKHRESQVPADGRSRSPCWTPTFIAGSQACVV